jgi:hypothetical protein
MHFFIYKYELCDNSLRFKFDTCFILKFTILLVLYHEEFLYSGERFQGHDGPPVLYLQVEEATRMEDVPVVRVWCEPLRSKCHSYRKIPFHMSEAGKAIFKNGVAQNIKMIAGQPVFVPGESICRHCGGNLNMEDPVAERWIASENVMFITNTFFGSGTCKA